MLIMTGDFHKTVFFRDFFLAIDQQPSVARCTIFALEFL